MKRAVILLCMLLIVFGTLSIAQEKKAEMKGDPGNELKQSIENGKGLFMDASLGTTGMSCNSCHIEGGMKAGKMGDMEIPPFTHVAKKYPGYFKMAKKIMTLDQVINWCILTPMEGTPLAWDDQRMADLAAYVASVNAMKSGEEKSKEEPKK